MPIIFDFISNFIKPFYATDLFQFPMKTSRKTVKKRKVFWCFQGVLKETSGMKQNDCQNAKSPATQSHFVPQHSHFWTPLNFQYVFFVWWKGYSDLTYINLIQDEVQKVSPSPLLTSFLPITFQRVEIGPRTPVTFSLHLFATLL